MPRQNVKSARIEARIAPDALDAIRRASEIEGRSLSDFVVAAAEAAARRTLEEERLIRLAAEDQRLFVETLLTPPEPHEALRRAARHRERLLGKS
ncbi:type II toxin-antitoxin system TacA family antitoxin [Afifella pfennigii]|uniref:type II toxin-antitoxin system TacA family antitoxin n=1 Tax=Afifella pfennigii TaxID=209897 RepID=UPI0004797025|nr:DUF1778 domain-containing protein [Afifella pfennigii]